MLIRILSEVKDNRRKQGRRYELVPVIFSAIAAVFSGADSYREIHSFIKNHYELLNVHFSLNWKNRHCSKKLGYLKSLLKKFRVALKCSTKEIFYRYERRILSMKAFIMMMIPPS